MQSAHDRVDHSSGIDGGRHVNVGAPLGDRATVENRGPERQVTVRFHVAGQPLRGEQLRIGCSGHGHRVVEQDAFQPEQLTV